MGIHHEGTTPAQRVYEDMWFTITGDDWPVPLHFLEKFAVEVAANEREACARVAENERPESGPQILPSEYRTGKIDASKIITAAIRARTA